MCLCINTVEERPNCDLYLARLIPSDARREFLGGTPAGIQRYKIINVVDMILCLLIKGEKDSHLNFLYNVEM